MTETEAARRRAINRIGTYLPWRRDWQPRDIDEYHRALDDLTPDAVDEAVTVAMRTRRTVPSASQLRDIHAEREATRLEARRAERARRPAGDGQGCPECRREYGDAAVDAGRHGEWIGDGTIICCRQHGGMHGITWRGSTHQPGGADPGEPSPDEWRHDALAGRYGETLRRVAEAGGGPRDVAAAVTSGEAA